MLVPGVQGAQGRGVYFSDIPRLKYSGGEHFKEEPERSPVFCVPMSGKWKRGKNKKKGREVSYHTDERVVALHDLKFFDDNEENIRYYYPSEVSFFKEPDTRRQGRHITSHFSDAVLSRKLEFDEAVRILREENEDTELSVGRDYILERLQDAVEEERLPEGESFGEMISEQETKKEDHEGIGIQMR